MRPNPSLKRSANGRPPGPGLAVRCTFLPTRAWRPAVAARLARTLGIAPPMYSTATNLITVALFTLSATLSSMHAQANDAVEKSVVALAGDTDRFNIGQDGFCGERTEIDHPSKAQFKIPAQIETFFYIRTTFRLQHATYVCESDFSFTPEPAALHIIPYSFEGRQCRLELFKTVPGGMPQPTTFKSEQRRSCLQP